MKITVLGTGTSSGVPVLTCECPVCLSADEKDKRLRVSVLIQTDDTHIVIDSGPDFRQQLLKAKLKKLDAVIYTHEHKDHTAGLDDVRPFNYLQGEQYLNIYAQKNVLQQLRREFHYAFMDEAYPGVPLLKPNEIDLLPFFIKKTKITPIQVMHHQLPVLGFRIGDFCYITDANHISDNELEKIKGSKVLIINALQKSPHQSHFTLDEAIAVAQKTGVKQVYFTHISHKMGLHEQVEKELPYGMHLAFDGLTIQL